MLTRSFGILGFYIKNRFSYWFQGRAAATYLN